MKGIVKSPSRSFANMVIKSPVMILEEMTSVR